MRFIFKVMMTGFALTGAPLSASSDPDKAILDGLLDVNGQVSADARAERMKALVSFIESLNSEQVNEVSDDSVDGLADLLFLDGEVGAYYGAIALGQLSCRAKRALPQIEEVLATYKPQESTSIFSAVGSSVSARDELAIAIRDIRLCIASSRKP